MLIFSQKFPWKLQILCSAIFLLCTLEGHVRARSVMACLLEASQRTAIGCFACYAFIGQSASEHRSPKLEGLEPLADSFRVHLEPVFNHKQVFEGRLHSRAHHFIITLHVIVLGWVNHCLLTLIVELGKVRCQHVTVLVYFEELFCLQIKGF